MPSVQSHSLIYSLDSIVERIPLRDLFPCEQPLEVELGSGDGSFLVEYAHKHPERNFIGIERLLGRARKLERKAARLGLTNIRVIRIESSYFLDFLLPPQSASALHVYFPDPWPKKKHHRHRLISSRFPEIAAKALGQAGEVFLRTDHTEYFKQMQEVFEAAKNFQPIPTPQTLLNVVTDFERDFQAEGISTLRASFRKR